MYIVAIVIKPTYDEYDQDVVVTLVWANENVENIPSYTYKIQHTHYLRQM